MSGRGPVVDASGNVYYMIGNGDWNGTRNLGESMVKFGSTTGMPLLDWFTPDTWSALNASDIDYGSSGPILIPGTDLIVGGGKASVFYMMHTGNLGHEASGNTQIVQSLANNGGEIKSGPVYWNRSGGVGPWMYVWSDNCDFLKAYHFNGTTFDTGIVSESTFASPCGNSGGVLTLSANGSTPGSGIIWASMPLADDGDHGVHQGVLRALDADDLTKELWDSNLNPTRDNSGNWPKFSPPTVANGRVYMASFPVDGMGAAPVNVYGLLLSTPAVASFVATDTTTEGSWHGVYGADGFSVANDSQSLPAYASFGVQNQLNYTWASSTSDPRALRTGSGTGRIAATWYNSSSFNFDVNFTDGSAHQFALYALDWDSTARAETIQIVDASSNAVLDTDILNTDRDPPGPVPPHLPAELFLQRDRRFL